MFNSGGSVCNRKEDMSPSSYKSSSGNTITTNDESNSPVDDGNPVPHSSGGQVSTSNDSTQVLTPSEADDLAPTVGLLRRDSCLSNQLCRILRQATLEPMLFLKMIAEANFGVVADTLEIDRICSVNLGYDAKDCKVMDDGNHTDLQVDVQRYQNNFNFYQALTASIFPLLVILFVGSLSDRYGRKPALIGVLLGFIALGVCYILVSVEASWPVEVLMAGTIAVNMTGSWVVFNMAVYSYVSDITTSKNRTKRMGILDFWWYIGSPLGTLLGGWLFRLAGYVAVFTTSTVLWVICLVYTVIFVKESKTPSSEQENEGTISRCGPFKNVLSLFQTGFKKRPNNGRLFIFTLIGLKLGVFLVQGHQVYKWSRVKLEWGPTEYSNWSTADSIIHQVGMVLWVSIAVKAKFHDCSTLIGGLISIMLWSVVLACITNPQLWWLVIVASVLGMLEGSMEPSIRSLLTTVTGSGEAGKILSLMGLLEAAWLTIDSLMYTSLYNACIQSFTQINFVVQASIALALIPVVCILKQRMISYPAQTCDKES